MNLSLSHFFKRTEPATLNNCESEQIHISGMVQNIAAMLVVEPDTFRIIGASDNMERIFGVSAVEILGLKLSLVHAEMAGELSGYSNDSGVMHDVLDVIVKSGDMSFDVITHHHAGVRFVEFIPNARQSADLVRQRMRLCSRVCAQIMNSANFAEARQLAVDAVRTITECDRVKVYRFLPDWSGAVEAESRADDMPSYLGLHFPQGDIPAQVREIMKIVPVRMIGTVSDDNVPIRTLIDSDQVLDQTWAVTRSVSAMHTAYLRNMGVASTFLSTLKIQGNLWGIFACHSKREHVVPVDSWSLVQEIGTSLMLRLEQEKRVATTEMITDLRRIENDFAAELRRHGQVEDVIVAMAPVLQKFLRADGFAFVYGDQLHTSGRTPPAAFIRTLINWAKRENTDSDQFQTTALHGVFPDASDYLDTACGIVIQPIVVHRVCQLIWFRGPVTQQVEWAGRPASKPVDTEDGQRIVGPRASFDKWVQQHSDQSLAWEPAELEAAREIFKEFLDIIVSQALLKEENESLRHFAHAAAHDIMVPLQGIQFALDWMKEDRFDRKSVEEHQKIAHQSAVKLQRLTQALLDFSVLHEQNHNFEDVALLDVVADARDLLVNDLKQSGAQVIISDLPHLLGNHHLLTRLLLNLFSNALKFRAPDRAPVIRVECVQQDPVVIAICDNGPGIEPAYAEQIFQPTKRLVSQDEIEGTGLGLSIARRIAEIHGGRIELDTSYRDGARFVIAFWDD